PEPIAQRRPDVPAQLAASIARCLRKDPAERWDSAEALCSSLRAAGVVDTPSAVESCDPAAAGGVLPDLVRGRAAFGRGAWREAYDHLTAASAGAELEAEDLVCLAEAAWWVADGRTSLRAREQAYRAYLQRGELRVAAAMALALAE